MEEREAGKDAFAEVVESWAERLEGLRVLRHGCQARHGLLPLADHVPYEDLGELGSELNASPLAGWLDTPYSYLATTKASQYTQARRPRKITPKNQPYLVAIPS